MTKKNFLKLIKHTYKKIEKKIEKKYSMIDLDILQEDYTLKIIFPNTQKIIFTIQKSLNQLWMATKDKGYYFEYLKKKWKCKRTHLELFKILKKIFMKII
ncbi:iron donor protein CyaY [Buchnera aphidicola]|uniref:iron donor protein CyaY n=1 Tax=Buchnera aphidicola TaxID=9 RepID=UPI0031B70A14